MTYKDNRTRRCREQGMHFLFDTETTGLPKGRNVSYSDDAAYSSCRLVSIAWFLVDDDTLDVVSEHNHLIKPDGYTVSQESTAIHGITHEYAMINGIPFSEIVDELVTSLNSCKYLVAHNISFDFGVLLHELYVHKNVDPTMSKVINHVFRMDRKCTMRQGKEIMVVKKFPKLIELYVHLLKVQPTGDLHNALVDTRCCYECYRAMNKKTTNVDVAYIVDVTTSVEENESVLVQ